MGPGTECATLDAEGSAPPRTPDRGTRALDVLVVEDDRAARFVTAATLRRQGYRVAAAESGFDAVTMVAECSYDLVLLDLQMPGIDGFETARRIRASEVGPARMPIVALTASASPADWPRCRAAGFDGVLRKPVRPVDLAAMLAREPPRVDTTCAPGDSGVPTLAGAGPLFDLDRLAELRRNLSDPIAAALLIGCLADLGRRLPALMTAAERGDVPAIETAAHAVAGVAGTYGLVALQVRMTRVLDAVRAGDLHGVRAAVAGSGEALAAAGVAVRAAVAPAA